MWDYKRTESNKRLYNVFLRYENDTGNLFTEYLGDEWAHSDKQAARYMSYKHGDNGNREVSYKGYTCRYYAKEVDI
jgi:hypothetical protein